VLFILSKFIVGGLKRKASSGCFRDELCSRCHRDAEQEAKRQSDKNTLSAFSSSISVCMGANSAAGVSKPSTRKVPVRRGPKPRKRARR
jgi:hypothetical protein